uniref:Uncharacterized protein C12orf56 n=1 Tax=Phallusia mammillata TaxID=59560 RepID=A0A6F9D8G4_9ASCI|nr:uncharacterized protein C12orf56 [Phallusia mammillata]
MIKGSEALSNCQHVLQQQSTTFYENFLRALLNVQLLKNSTITNQELTGLCDEYLEAAVDIFYYLIVMAEQIAWKAMEVTHPNLTSHTLFSAISKHPNLELFLDLLMRKCVSLWTQGDVKSSPDVTAAVVGSNSALTPSECVRLYRSFVVLYRIITKIRTAKHRACSKYKEEFKYYIRPDSVTAKIPESYPACAILRNVIRSVAVLVLPGQNSR